MITIRRIRKSMATLTLLAFLCQNMGWAASELHAAFNTAEEFRINPLQIQLPAQWGDIKESYDNPAAGSLVVHIQTAHGNYEAQKNIQKIIGRLNSKYKIRLLFLEGANDKLDPSVFRFFKDNRLNLKVADLLMRQGEFTGAEMFLLGQGEKAGGGAEGYGIENTELYRRDFKLFRKVMGEKDRTETFYKEWDGSIRRAESRIFYKELRGFVKEWRKFRASSDGLLGYIRHLRQYGLKYLSLDLKDPKLQAEYGALLRILKLQEIESRLDGSKIAAEKKALLEFLQDKIDKKSYLKLERLGPGTNKKPAGQPEQAAGGRQETPALASGLGQPEQAADGRPEMQARADGPGYPRFLFEKIMRQVSSKGLDFRKYPNYVLFAEYLILESEIDSQRLFEETERFSEKLFEVLAKTAEEKELLRLILDSELLRKLLTLELSRSEYEKVLSRKETLSPAALKRRLASLSPEKAKVSAAVGAADIADPFAKALEFYALALEREKYFLQKTTEVMREKNETVSVVVTGGFHAEGVLHLLSEKGIPYVSIMPRMTQAEQGHDIYLRAMMGETRLAETAQIEKALRELPAPSREKLVGPELLAADRALDLEAARYAQAASLGQPEQAAGSRLDMQGLADGLGQSEQGASGADKFRQIILEDLFREGAGGKHLFLSFYTGEEKIEWFQIDLNGRVYYFHHAVSFDASAQPVPKVEVPWKILSPADAGDAAILDRPEVKRFTDQIKERLSRPVLLVSGAVAGLDTVIFPDGAAFPVNYIGNESRPLVDLSLMLDAKTFSMFSGVREISDFLGGASLGQERRLRELEHALIAAKPEAILPVPSEQSAQDLVLERVRAARVNHEPVEAVTVCTANYHRSAVMHWLLKSAAEREGWSDIHVRSGGTALWTQPEMITKIIPSRLRPALSRLDQPRLTEFLNNVLGKGEITEAALAELYLRFDSQEWQARLPDYRDMALEIDRAIRDLNKTLEREQGLDNRGFQARAQQLMDSDAGKDFLREAQQDYGSPKPITPEMVRKATIILVAGEEHKNTIEQYFPEAAGKILLFTQLAPSVFPGKRDVPDPGKGEITEEELFSKLRVGMESAVIPLFRGVQKRGVFTGSIEKRITQVTGVTLPGPYQIGHIHGRRINPSREERPFAIPLIHAPPAKQELIKLTDEFLLSPFYIHFENVDPRFSLLITRALAWFSDPEGFQGTVLALPGHPKIRAIGRPEIIGVSATLKDQPLAWIHAIFHAAVQAGIINVDEIPGTLSDAGGAWFRSGAGPLDEDGFTKRYLIRRAIEEIFSELSQRLAFKPYPDVPVTEEASHEMEELQKLWHESLEEAHKGFEITDAELQEAVRQLGLEQPVTLEAWYKASQAALGRKVWTDAARQQEINHRIDHLEGMIHWLRSRGNGKEKAIVQRGSRFLADLRFQIAMNAIQKGDLAKADFILGQLKFSEGTELQWIPILERGIQNYRDFQMAREAIFQGNAGKAQEILEVLRRNNAQPDLTDPIAVSLEKLAGVPAPIEVQSLTANDVHNRIYFSERVRQIAAANTAAVFRLEEYPDLVFKISTSNNRAAAEHEAADMWQVAEKSGYELVEIDGFMLMKIEGFAPVAYLDGVKVQRLGRPKPSLKPEMPAAEKEEILAEAMAVRLRLLKRGIHWWDVKPENLGEMGGTTVLLDNGYIMVRPEIEPRATSNGASLGAAILSKEGRIPEFVLKVALPHEQGGITEGVLYINDEAALRWAMTELGLLERPGKQTLAEAYQAFRRGELDRAILDRMGLDENRPREDNVSLVLFPGVLDVENPGDRDTLAEAFAGSLEAEDQVILVRRESSPVLDALIRSAGRHGIKMRTVQDPLVSASSIDEMLKGEPPIIISPMSEKRDLEINFKGRKFKFNDQELHSRIDKVKVIGLLRKIADYPDKFNLIGLTAKDGYWEIGGAFADFIEKLYNESRTEQLQAKAA